MTTEARTTNPDVDHLSVSQISSMQRCQQAYLFRYGFGMIEPPRWAFTIGKAVERGVLVDYGNFIKAGEHISNADMREATRDNLVRLLDSEPPIDKDYGKDEAIDHVTDAAGVFHRDVCTQVQPTMLEAKVEYSVDPALPPVVGYIDVVAANALAEGSDATTRSTRSWHSDDGVTKDVIIDNKTSGAAGGWGADDVAAAMQPIAYAVGMEAAGRKVGGFQFHIARYASGGRWLKTKVTQVLDAPLTDTMRAGWTRVVTNAFALRRTILKDGVALPSYGWQCKGCGFRDACSKEWGREPPK
jgi:hypothetical protein